MCNCIIFCLIYFFLSFFLFKLPKFWVPDVYPSPVASCVKCPPPRDFVSLYSRVQQGEIIPADIFSDPSEAADAHMFPVGKTRTLKSWSLNNRSLPPCVAPVGESTPWCWKREGRRTYPASISKTRMPRAHQSTARPWPLLWMTSGAKYSGVPHSVQVLRRVRIQILWISGQSREFYLHDKVPF